MVLSHVGTSEMFANTLRTAYLAVLLVNTVHQPPNEIHHHPLTTHCVYNFKSFYSLAGKNHQPYDIIVAG